MESEMDLEEVRAAIRQPYRQQEVDGLLKV
jgi:hypothetical protein